jgi:hypothetical protein
LGLANRVPCGLLLEDTLCVKKADLDIALVIIDSSAHEHVVMQILVPPYICGQPHAGSLVTMLFLVVNDQAAADIPQSEAEPCLPLRKALFAHPQKFVCHLQRLLNYIVPEAVHIMEAGRIIYSGGIEVADILEKDGYEGIRSLIRKEAAAGKQPVGA